VGDGSSLARALREAAASETPFDLLLSDVRMPGEGTFSVLRGAGGRPRTILLTAYPEDSVFFNAYQCDCLCVISKPFDATELRRIVGLVLSDRTNGRPRRVDLV
jgi:DNA-binding NarL/FixJ family response regulator